MEKQLLSQQENIKKFSQLLDENGMNDQKKEFEYLIQYIDQMENQFDTVLEELRSVKQELNTIQDKTFRATANKVVDKVTAKVTETKKTLIKLKQHVIKTVDKAVNEFKKQGKSALSSAVKKLNVNTLSELEKNEQPKKSVKSELNDIKKTNSRPTNTKVKSKNEELAL